MPSRAPSWPAPIVALAGWVIPGGGYFLLGQRARGLTICVTVLAMFVAGLLIGGIRVIDVPGYKNGNQERIDERGRPVAPGEPGYDTATWTMLSGRFVSEIVGKIWYLPQLSNGPVALWASEASISAAQRQIAATHSRIMEIGTLYTAVAGVLNLLAIMDAAARAGGGRRVESSGEPAIAAPARGVV